MKLNVKKLSLNLAKGTVWVALALVVVAIVSFFATNLYYAWKTYPESIEQPNWAEVGSEEIPTIVTIDPDGARRVTQVWIALAAEQAYLRTSSSAWYGNLQRSSWLDLRIGGLSHRCSVTFIDNAETETAVHAAFLEKYPQRSGVFRRLGVTTTNVMRLACSSNADAQANR